MNACTLARFPFIDGVTNPLPEVLDFRLSECEILHLLLQIPHFAVLDLDLLDLDTLLSPPLYHPLLLTGTQE